MYKRQAESLSSSEELALNTSVNYVVRHLFMNTFTRSGTSAIVGDALSDGVGLMIFTTLEYLITGSINPSRVVENLAMTMGSMAGAYGLTALISTYGVASTGVVIGKLSGAAATNAMLAWLGGGTLASGGWGVAAGSLVFSGVTLGVGAVVAWGSKLIYDQWDARDRSYFQSELLRYVIDSSQSSRVSLDAD